MLTLRPTELDLTFAALADPTRRAILQRLWAGESTVSQLAAPFAISAPAISRHLRVLESAGLIIKRRDGQHLHCRLQPEALENATRWLEFFRDFRTGGLSLRDPYSKQGFVKSTKR